MLDTGRNVGTEMIIQLKDANDLGNPYSALPLGLFSSSCLEPGAWRTTLAVGFPRHDENRRESVWSLKSCKWDRWFLQATGAKASIQAPIVASALAVYTTPLTKITDCPVVLLRRRNDSGGLSSELGTSRISKNFNSIEISLSARPSSGLLEASCRHRAEPVGREKGV